MELVAWEDRVGHDQVVGARNLVVERRGRQAWLAKARQWRCAVASDSALRGSKRGTGESESERERERETALPLALP